MKVRRKSEIAEAVQLPNESWRVTNEAGRRKYFTAEELWADYEPAPDAMHSENEVGCFHYFVDHRVCKYCGERAAPSVSEEQPAQIVCNCDVEMFGKHCDWCPLFREICDECAMSLPKHATGCPAKAKMESLSKNPAGEKGGGRWRRGS